MAVQGSPGQLVKDKRVCVCVFQLRHSAGLYVTLHVSSFLYVAHLYYLNETSHVILCTDVSEENLDYL